MATYPATRESANHVFYLAILMAVAALMSFFVWMGESLRLDEAQSVWQTSRDLLGVLDVIAKDVHMPLYFIGLHFWAIIFGTSEAALRVFSLIFFLASIPALYHLGRTAYSPRVGFYAALLGAVSPFLQWYGSEARMYALLFFVTALSHAAFIRLWRSPSRGLWLGFAAISVAGLFTHVFYVFILVVQAFFFAWRRHLFPAGSVRAFTRLGLFLGFLGILWFIYRTIVGAGLSDPLLSKPTSVDFFNVFSNFFIGFQTDYTNTLVLSLWPVLVFVGFTFLAKKRHAESETMYLLSASFLPVLLAFLVSVLYQPAFLSRYLIVSLPSLYVLTVYFLSSYKTRVSTIALSILVALMVGMLFVQASSLRSPVKEDYRAAARYVEERAERDDLFVVSAPFITYPIEYYYRGEARLATFPRWDRFAKDLLPEPYTPTLIEEDSREWASVYEDVFMLFGYDQGYEEEVRLYMDTHYERIDMKTFSPGLTLYTYRLRYITP